MTQGNWNQPGAYSAWQPPPPAWSSPPPPILGTAIPWRVRPKASGSVVLPIAGALLVILCLLLLPWGHGGNKWVLLPEITANIPSGARGIGAWYVSGWCYPLAFFAILYAFAANLDSPTFRWLHFGFMVPIPLGLFALIALASSQHAHNINGDDLGRRSINGEAIIVAVGLLALAVAFFALAFAKRLVIRVIGGMMMLGYLLIHTVAVADLLSRKAHLLPFAFAATLGYLLCAVGAFIGPRYVPSAR
jgi:hypothetical protein